MLTVIEVPPFRPSCNTDISLLQTVNLVPVKTKIHINSTHVVRTPPYSISDTLLGVSMRTKFKLLKYYLDKTWNCKAFYLVLLCSMFFHLQRIHGYKNSCMIQQYLYSEQCWQDSNELLRCIHGCLKLKKRED